MGLPGIDYQALLRKYIAFLIDQYGDDYFDEAMHLVDMFPALDPMEMVRAIAAARILMPASRVRLAAGRLQLSPEATTLCFLAGANSIFVGEKLLTTPNPGPSEDEKLLETLGLKPLEPHAV